MGIAASGTSEALPLARRCRGDRKELETTHNGYSRLPWVGIWKFPRRDSVWVRLLPGRLMDEGTTFCLIIHAEHGHRLLHGESVPKKDAPNLAVGRSMSRVGILESFPSKKIKITRCQRLEPRQYPRAIPLPKYECQKFLNSGVVPSDSNLLPSIDVPDSILKRHLPCNSSLDSLGMFSNGRQAQKSIRVLICQRQEQERTALSVATCHREENMQTQRDATITAHRIWTRDRS